MGQLYFLVIILRLILTSCEESARNLVAPTSDEGSKSPLETDFSEYDDEELKKMDHATQVENLEDISTPDDMSSIERDPNPISEPPVSPRTRISTGGSFGGSGSTGGSGTGGGTGIGGGTGNSCQLAKSSDDQKCSGTGVGGGLGAGDGIVESCEFVKSKEDEKCFKHSNNPCNCYREGCEIRQDKQSCVPAKTCEARLKDCPENSLTRKCLRPGAYYGHGGVLCRNEASKGYCYVHKTVIGVKATMRAGSTMGDSRGVKYLHETNYTDPGQTRQVGKLDIQNKKCNWNQFGNAEQIRDSRLYKTQTHGKPNVNNCLSFTLPRLREDGRYELSIKFIENWLKDRKEQRNFVVKLGDLVLAREFDVFKYVGYCKPMELIYPIEVTNGGTTIIVQGFPEMLNDEKRIGQLSFCYSSCPGRGNHNYVFSSFYIAWLGPENPKCDLVNPSGYPCRQYDNSVCRCKQAGCEYFLTDKYCVPSRTCQQRFARCPGTSLEQQCLRKGAYYVHGGVLCKNEERTGDCYVQKTVIGIKTTLKAGQTIRDTRGINYTYPARYEDPGKIERLHRLHLQEQMCNWRWNQVPPRDIQLYKPVIHGQYQQRNCISYIIPPMKESGRYELSLKFVENYIKNNQDRRSFLIKLNDLVIINQAEIFKYVGNCQPMEIILLFEVSEDGNTISLEGFPDMPNDKEHVGKLSYCHGQCPGHSFYASSFYIAKIGKDDHRCEVNTAAAVNCDQHGNDVCECSKVGCESSLAKGTCELTETCNERKNRCPHSTLHYSCLRADVYYADGGLLCKNEVEDGPCNILETILGVKTTMDEGQTMIDSRNVIYTHEKNYTDPGKTRQVRPLKEQNDACKWDTLQEGEQKEDIQLYKTMVHGKLRENNCLSYSIPIINDTGIYELSMKFLESVLKDKKPRRTFTVKMGELVVIREMDVFKYVGNCQPMEVVVKFEINNDGKDIVVQGFPPMPNDLDHFGTLSFCFSGCTGTSGHNYIISSFYLSCLAKYYNADRGHNVDDSTCSESHAHTCPIKLTDGYCLRPGVFYMNNQSICKNDELQGHCKIAWQQVGIQTVYDSRRLGTSKIIRDSRNMSYPTEQLFSYIGASRQLSPIKEQLAKCRWKWNEMPLRDIRLYKTQVHGRIIRGACLEYFIPQLKEVGLYEFSFKFLENQLTDNSTRRFFNILVDGHVVISELDVFQHVGFCKPMEVVIHLRVHEYGRVRYFTVNGIHVGIMWDNRPFTYQYYIQEYADSESAYYSIIGPSIKISFCNPKCLRTNHISSYIVSSFYITKLTTNHNTCDLHLQTDNHCLQYGSSIYACKAAGCETNLVKGTCEPLQNCNATYERQDGMEHQKCLRAGAYYVHAGVLCNNTIDVGNCRVLETLLAVVPYYNNQSDKRITDSRNITYVPTNYYSDVAYSYSRVTGLICPFITLWTSEQVEDMETYVWMIRGTKNVHRDFIPPRFNDPYCISYKLPEMRKPGLYELSLKTLCISLWENDCETFIVNLGMITIINELNISNYARTCKPLEVIVLIEVVDDGKSVKVQGFPEMPNNEEYIGLLSFCFGKSSRGHRTNFYKEAYAVSSFYLALVWENHEPSGSIIPKADPCNLQFYSNCGCKNAGCESNLSSGACTSMKMCWQDDRCPGTWASDHCLRRLAFYLDGGVLCKNLVNHGNCTVQDTIIAIKTTLEAGESTTDSRKIRYIHTTNFTDRQSTKFMGNLEEQRRACNASRDTWKEEQKVDGDIYVTVANGTRGNTGCLSYLLPPINDPGIYELSLKFLENTLENDERKRMFVIKLGNLTILSELDVFQYAGYCQPFEIIVPIEITNGGSTVVVKGFSEMPNDREHVGELSFCSGTCQGSDFSYIISAFYIARVGPGYGQCELATSDEDSCSKHEKFSCDCKIDGCQMLPRDGSCQQLRSCDNKYSNCPGRLGGDYCLRRGAFYADGGALCKNEEDRGSCSDLEAVIAVQAIQKENQTRIVDSRHITYEYESFVDSRSTRRELTTLRCNPNFQNIHRDDAILYTTLVYGAQGRPSCLRYFLPVMTEPGNYELSLKFIEPFISSDYNRRSFHVRLGNLVVVRELNVYKIVGTCQPMEIIIPFKVSNDGKIIEVLGFPPMTNNRRYFGRLSFCYGSCSRNRNTNHNYMISAFYIAKYISGDGEIRRRSNETHIP